MIIDRMRGSTTIAYFAGSFLLVDTRFGMGSRDRWLLGGRQVAAIARWDGNEPLSEFAGSHKLRPRDSGVAVLE